MKNAIIQPSGNNFIDDNHDDILSSMDELGFMVRDNWNPKTFATAVSHFIVQLENHFSHEETILKGANFKDIAKHTIKHREIALRLRVEAMAVLQRDDAINFLVSTRSTIFSHELIEDQGYWPLFDSENSPTILHWSKKYETGNSDVDNHHQSLANYINRLNIKLVEFSDVDFACRELQNLYEYSKFHFLEEEEILGESLRFGHKENHISLLEDLDTLIFELKTEEIKTNSIGEYLKYWLLNHIQNFDIPAFTKH